KRGHVIGTHSCSHPPRISHCSSVQLHDEWERSCSFLSDVLGEPIRTGSVPGGYYSRGVANAAVRAGVRMLFTSEPTVGVKHAGDCAIFGRFMVQRSTSPQVAAELARGTSMECYKQAMAWKAKKCLKAVGGPAWLRFRKWALEQ